MNQTFSIPLTDCPVVALTVGQLQEVIRQEFLTALNENIKGAIRQDSLNRDHSLGLKPYLTIREAAKLAGLGISTVRLRIKQGRLKPHSDGTRKIISRAELDRFLGS
jgi:excisionase family DNA binding protein